MSSQRSSSTCEDLAAGSGPVCGEDPAANRGPDGGEVPGSRVVLVRIQQQVGAPVVVRGQVVGGGGEDPAAGRGPGGGVEPCRRLW